MEAQGAAYLLLPLLPLSSLIQLWCKQVPECTS